MRNWMHGTQYSTYHGFIAADKEELPGTSVLGEQP